MSYYDIEEIVMKPERLEDRLSKRIARKRGDVFVRADFDDLGGYDQVGRALATLVRNKQLIKVSQGIYARATTSPFTGDVLPARGLRTLADALRRVGVDVVPTRMERDYNAGRTTQVPTGRVVGVRRRVRRKIGYGGFFLSFERAGPAPR